MAVASPDPVAPREFCLACFRPKVRCLCAEIPTIHNQIDVLVLQHRRERQHAFNSVRIVERALQRRKILIGYTPDLAVSKLPLTNRAGLLYPGDDAQSLEAIDPENRPEQLVILDGTWHHAKTMFRDIPALHQLPKFRLPPVTPGRYRIRREPNLESMSTLEAVVRALQVLEPETVGLDDLLATFDRMVDRQMDCIDSHKNLDSSHSSSRRVIRKAKRVPRLPKPLLDDVSNLVVVYGESEPPKPRVKNRKRRPVYWLARRMGFGDRTSEDRCATEDRFACAIESPAERCESFLQNLELPDSVLQGSVSLSQFQSAWKDFIRPNDTLVAYNQGTIRMLESAGVENRPSVILKRVCANRDRRTFSSIENLLEAHEIVPSSLEFPGRAGRRLANALAVLQWLLDSQKHSQ